MTKYIPHVPAPWMPPIAVKTRMDRAVEIGGDIAAIGVFVCVAILVLMAFV